MSFLLSKLLPVFIYPLGLSLILMGFSLFRLTRKRKAKSDRLGIMAFGTAIAIMYFSSIPLVSGLLLRSLEYQNLPSSLPNAEAIVVLGGGLRAQIAPRSWVEVSEAGDRILHGSRLWLQGKAPLMILSGGRTSIYQEYGKAESADMAEIAVAMGVKPEAIAQEPDSLNTYENAVNVQKILQTRNISKILLVTSALHMPRSLAIFRKLGIDAIAAPTDFIAIDVPSEQTSINIFTFLPEASALKDTTSCLKEYIGLFMSKLQGWA